VTARGLALTLAAGVLLGWHFATWITSLEHTGVAASMVFVNSSPLWIVLLAWLFLKERPRKGVGAGILTAVAGGLILGLDGTSAAAGAAGDRPLFGNMLALSGAVFVSGNMLLGRAAQRSGLSLMAYSGLSYLAAAVSLLPLPWLLGQPYYGPYPLSAFAWIAALALVSQLIGHTGLNYALRFLDPTLIATVLLLEPAVASILAWAVFGELPGFATAGGGLVLLAGIALVIRAQGRPARQNTTENVL